MMMVQVKSRLLCFRVYYNVLLKEGMSKVSNTIYNDLNWAPGNVVNGCVCK